MSPNIKKNQWLALRDSKGFTLIELLMATAIMGAVSFVGVQLLYDTLSTRSRQYSIENSVGSIRPIISTISSAIQSAQSVMVVGSTQIKIVGNTDPTTGAIPCLQFQYNAADKTIEQISDESDCTDPATRITPESIEITKFQFSPTPSSIITINIAGLYKDNLGERPFNYSTSVVNRVSI